MKKVFFLFFLLAGVLLIANGASAFPIAVNDILNFSDGPGGGNGGSFKVDVKDKGSSFDFFTFCVEMTGEYINFSDDFKVDSLSRTTIGSGRDITEQTAWLYKSALNGTLDNYTSDNETDNTQLQLAIWESVGYNVSIGTKGADWLTASDSLIGKGDFFGVQVMNLIYAKNGSNAQDQLVSVPEPATMMLLGTAFFGLAIIQRKKFFRK